MQRTHVLLLSLLILTPIPTPTVRPNVRISSGVTIPTDRPLSGALLNQQSGPVRQPDTPVITPGGWPQQATRRTVDANQLKSESQELVALVHALPEQIDKIGNGQYPKDLIENLKKIEKIAKRIRGEVS